MSAYSAQTESCNEWTGKTSTCLKATPALTDTCQKLRNTRKTQNRDFTKKYNSVWRCQRPEFCNKKIPEL